MRRKHILTNNPAVLTQEPAADGGKGKEKDKKEVSGFRGWADEGKILAEIFLWRRMWIWILPILPSPEEHTAPLTDSSSPVQSPPPSVLSGPLTLPSTLPRAPPPPQRFKVKFTASSSFAPHPAPRHPSYTSSHCSFKSPTCFGSPYPFFLNSSLSLWFVCMTSLHLIRTPQAWWKYRRINGRDLLLPWHLKKKKKSLWLTAWSFSPSKTLKFK